MGYMKELAIIEHRFEETKDADQIRRYEEYLHLRDLELDFFNWLKRNHKV